MRTITTAQGRVYAGMMAQYAVRVVVDDAVGTPTDLSTFLGRDWILEADWGEDVDSPGMDANVVLARASDAVSLQPGRDLSAANLLGSMLAVGRDIVISIAVTAIGRPAVTADWIEMFRGTVQTVDGGGTESIALTAIGLQSTLQAAWVEDASTPWGTDGGEPVQDVIGDILTAWVTSPPTLAVPVDPLWSITTYEAEVKSVWDAIVQLSDTLGWSLRYLYDDGSSTWKLTLYEPDRTLAGTPYVLEKERIIGIETAETSLDSVRNVAQVTYGDTANIDASGQPTPATYTTTEAASVAAYGRRWMGITLDATSLIDTSAEATRMADAILADVAYPMTTYHVEIPLFHAVQIDDVITLPADGVYLDTATNAGVVGYRHKVGESLRTTINVRSQGAIAHSSSWMEMSAQPGIAPILQTQAPLGPDSGLDAAIREVMGGVQVQPDMYNGNRKGGFQVEIHAGAIGFTPDLTAGSATLIGRAKDAALHLPADVTRLPIGVSRDVVIYYLNDRGVRSAAYRKARTATRPGLGWVQESVRFAGSFPGSTFSSLTRGATFPPDGWNMVVGTWDTAAKQDSGGTLVAPLTGQYALTLLTSAATEVLSELSPVTATRCYVSQLAVYASAIGVSDIITLELEWMAADTTTVISTDTIYDNVLSVATSWVTFKRTHSPPSGAKYARMRATKAATAFSFALDRWLFEEDQERDDEAARISLVDEFVGADSAAIGAYPWVLTVETGVVDPGAASITKIAAADWAHSGIASLEVADPGSYPLAGYSLSLGTNAAPMAAGLPPVGASMAWIVRMGTATADVRAWIGLWENEGRQVGPDAQVDTTFSQRGIGFLADGNWWGIVRVTNGGFHINRQVDMGVAANTSWRALSWRRTDAGIIFLLNGVQVGSFVSTTYFSDSISTFPMFGLAATVTDQPSIQVDKMALYTLMDRT